MFGSAINRHNQRNGLTKLHVQPNQEGRTKGRDSGSIFLPRRQFIDGGMAYVIPRATTEAEMIALLDVLLAVITT